MSEALLSKQYHLKWTRCADLPFPMYDAFVAIDGSHVYVTGSADRFTGCQVFHYDLTTDQWERLPEPGHRLGVLCMVGDYLTIFGGRDVVTDKIHNRVSTYDRDTNRWSNYYPNMTKSRSKPGVIVYQDYVLAMGGRMADPDIIHGSIEMMNYRQRTTWVEISVTMPVTMSSFKPTIAGKHLLIVGYNHDGSRYTTSCQLPLATIISSDQVASHWEEISPAPHYYSVTVPYSNPPLIIGGNNVKGVPTSDISLYDTSKKSWIKVNSLTTARKHVGVATINSDSLIVVGGTSGGGSIEANTASSMSIVEMGHIVRNY